jgi:RimK family alpha-L-glutamate ligase
MKVSIVSARTGWHTDQLCRALSARGHVASVVPYQGLMARVGGRSCGLSSAGDELLDADAVLARIIPDGSLEQIIFRVDALHWLEEHGVPVMNPPRAIERSVDKFYTSALLHEAGVPTPQTVVCESPEEALRAVRELRDVVIKPIFGSMGHGLVRVSDPDTAFRVIKSLDHIRSVFYVQRTIDHDGRDIRVFVVGGRVLAAIERSATNGDWRTNVARGAAVRAVDVSDEWSRLAVRAATVVGAEYAGVDLLPARDGSLFVIEVNGIPGWHGLQQATGIDVASVIVEHLEGFSSRRHTSRAGEAQPVDVGA